LTWIFSQAPSDYSLFIRNNTHNIVYLLVYADDIIIIGSNEIELAMIKAKIEQNFKIKVLGRLSFFLGIEVSYSIEGIYLS